MNNMYFENSFGMPLKEILPTIQDRIMTKTTYFGVQTLKNPLDAWVYQEILFEVKPQIIIEIGNMNGGSTLMLAHLCDLMGTGKVIGLDLSHTGIPGFIKCHPRITFIEGDACKNVELVKKLIQRDDKVLVIEDSSHTFENTLNVLRLFSPIVTSGSYFIIEDSICHHGLDIGPDPGPFEAIETFVKENNDFEIDRGKESFLITWNPKGFLKKK
jgi:cephalosporin hydroxylase